MNYDILYFVSEVDDMNSARQIDYGKSPFIEKLYDEVIWDIMTLLDKLISIFSGYPLENRFHQYKRVKHASRHFWVHKSYFLDADVTSSKHWLFKSLIIFMKYCEDDLGTSRGMSKSDRRESYGMMYQVFPFL